MTSGSGRAGRRGGRPAKRAAPRPDPADKEPPDGSLPSPAREDPAPGEPGPILSDDPIAAGLPDDVISAELSNDPLVAGLSDDPLAADLPEGLRSPGPAGDLLPPELPEALLDAEPEDPPPRREGRRARRGRKGSRSAEAVTRFDPLTRYVQEVRAIPLLTREEETAFARRYRDEKDAEAARRLVVANLSLVVKIALMFRRAVANALDLIQEGNLGLLQAVEKFDPDVGVRFSTYAAWWVKAYILKYLLDNARLVRVGTTNARRKLIYNLQRERSRLEALGIAAGPRLLAERFGVTEEDVRDVQATLDAGDVPLDAPIAEDDEGKSRIGLLADPAPSIEEQVARRELQEAIEEKIRQFAGRLGERDRYILENRLLSEEPQTLQAIGEKFSVTREAVRLSEEKLVRQLKEHLRAELGEDVLLQFRR